MLSLLLLLSITHIYALTQVSVLRTVPSTSLGTYGNINPQTGKSLPIANATTRITFRLTQEDGTKDPRLFYKNSMAFQSEYVDEQNRVHQMQCTLFKNDPVVVYRVEQVEMIPMHVQTIEIPFLKERVTSAEAWARDGSSIAAILSGVANNTGSSNSDPQGSSAFATRRRLLQTGNTAIDLNELQNPRGYLGATLTAKEFNASLNDAENMRDNVALLMLDIKAGQKDMVNQIQAISNALQRSKQALDLHTNQSFALQNDTNTLYQQFVNQYAAITKANNQSLIDAAEIQRVGLQRTKQAYVETQGLIQDAKNLVDGILGNPSSTDFYNNMVDQLAVITQTLINKVDYIQLENDNDYLTEQAFSNDLQNLYGNIAERRTLGSLFKPDGPIRKTVDAAGLSLFVPDDVALPGLDNLDPFVFEAAYVYTTALDFGASVSYNDPVYPLRTAYYDYDVGMSLDEIQPQMYQPDPNIVQQSSSQLMRAQYLIGRGSGTQRQYLNYRRITIYCTPQTIIGLQNNWLNLLQVQQLIGPAGCDPDAGTCRCWAYVRRQRCSVQSIPFINVNPTVINRVKTVTRVPQSITDVLSANAQGDSCPNGEEMSSASFPSWFDETNDDGTTCNLVYGTSATGLPGCQLVTNITLLHTELEAMCLQPLGVVPAQTNGINGVKYAYWQNAEPTHAYFINSTRLGCSTNYQLMPIQANKYGDTLPFSYYQQQRAAVGAYVKAAARTREIEQYGYLPRMGRSSSQPYYPQGTYHKADPSQYLTADGSLPRPWQHPQRIYRGDMMTYAATSPYLVPVYRMRRQTLQQNISITCTIDGTQTITQQAHDVTIEPQNAAGMVGYEPREMWWVGYLDDMIIPASHPFSEFLDAQGRPINETRFLLAVPDEAIGSGTPESRRNKINYIRCNQACCDARARSIDPTMTCANLTLNYTSDVTSLAQRRYAEMNGLPVPAENPAIDNMRTTAITVDEYLKSELRDTFDPIPSGDTASRYFQPLTFRSDSFLAAQGILDIQPGQSSYTPLYGLRGPVPLQCDLAWYKQQRLPLPDKCEFLETHEPIANTDPVTGVFSSWDKQGYLEFAQRFYTTTFSIAIPSKAIALDNTVVSTCPQPSDVALLASLTAAPQVRVYNERNYNISLYLYVQPSNQTGGQANCLAQRLQTIVQPLETVVLTTPFANMCDQLSIVLFTSTDDHVWSAPATVDGPPVAETPCWSWSGNVTSELNAIQKQQKLLQSRLQTGQSPTKLSTDAIASGLSQTTQVVANAVSANEMARTATLYYSSIKYATLMQDTVLRLLNNSVFRSNTTVPTAADVENARNRLAIAKGIASNLQSLIISTAAQTMQNYDKAINTSASDIDAARAAFSDAANAALANLTATAAYLRQRMVDANALKARYDDASTRLQTDLNVLAYQAAKLDAVSKIFGDVSVARFLQGQRFQTYPIIPSVWSIIGNTFESLGLGVVDVLTHPMELLDFVIGIVMAVIEFGLNLAESIACKLMAIVGLGFLCNGSFFVILLIIACVIGGLVFCCCFGKPMFRLLCSNRSNGKVAPPEY
jgi:hypothetical protein